MSRSANRRVLKECGRLALGEELVGRVVPQHRDERGIHLEQSSLVVGAINSYAAP